MSSRHARQPQSCLRLAVLALGCLLLALGASTAFAKPDHGGQGQGQGEGHGQGRSQEQGEPRGHGRGKEAAEAPSGGAWHGHQGAGESNAHSQGSGNGSEHSEAHGHGGGTNGQSEHGHGHDRGEHGKADGAGAGGSQGQGGAGATGENSGSTSGKGKAASARQTHAAATRSSGSAPAAARPALSSSAVPAATTAAAPAPATTAAPAAAPVASPSVGSLHPQPASHAERARRGRSAGNASRAHTAARRAFAPASTAIALTSALAAGPDHARPAHNRHRTLQAEHGGSQPPIVQTITKIVGVVPLAVWIAGGALLALALALAFGSRLLAKRARQLERQRGELLADVGLLQTTLLPAPPAGTGPIGASVAFKPADGPAAGGDFYDVFALEDGTIAAIVGDVSGHGRAALPHTALLRYTLRAYLEAGLSPREALRTAGAVLERQLEGVLATAVLATYHPRERTLVYACAGHPPPIVLGKRPLEPLAVSSAPPIGAGMTTGTRQTVVSLPGAAQVCLHTDGVTDARTGSELYGSERLTRALAALGPAATAPELLDRVGQQTDVRPDDMAACLLSLSGDPVEPVTLAQELELYDGDGMHERAERFLLACGLDLAASARVAGEARARAEQAGSVLIEARPSGPGAGAPSARVRCDEEPDIHASDTRRLATVGGTR
ncbi:MAG TPA: PP2C family protein-serine/threonine phosphatase [Solirubrobacteraceae bacterium]|nr:PP2C family protein-serine/threonine phosphatase [Solirubrobacteraceae bacterium]